MSNLVEVWELSGRGESVVAKVDYLLRKIISSEEMLVESGQKQQSALVSQKTFQFVCQSVAPFVSQREETSSTLVLYMRFCARQQPNLLEALCYQKFLRQISQMQQTDL